MAPSKRLSTSEKSDGADIDRKKAKKQRESKVEVESDTFDADTDNEEIASAEAHAKVKKEATACEEETDAEEGEAKLSANVGKESKLKQEDTAENEDSTESDENIYVWATYKDFILMLPKPVYNFWTSLLDCKNWGEARALCDNASQTDWCFTDNFYVNVLLKRFKEHNEHEYGKSVEDPTESQPFSKEDLTLFSDEEEQGFFPFPIEKIQLFCVRFDKYSWMEEFSYEFMKENDCGDYVFFGASFVKREKEEIMKKINERGCVAKEEPNLLLFTETVGEWYANIDPTLRVDRR